jgi:hypothetical protein
MSKVSKWLKAGEAIEAKRKALADEAYGITPKPFKVDPVAIAAEVTVAGKLRLHAVHLEMDQALALATWIVDAYGDGGKA